MGFVNLWDRIVGKTTDKNSKIDAKQRLQLVLMHDRTDIPYENLENMKKEIFQVVSKYIDIDLEALEVNLENVDQCVALVANIPIRKVRKPENQN
jgi:cell division topological specificity factor